jgi:aspartate/methionine/tyrosine aminotransferase
VAEDRLTRVMGSPYMEWAKTRSQARFNLASSGVPDYPLSDLPVRLEDLELTGPSTYGWTPLQERLAAKCGVGADNVVAAMGTSMANYLALAALVDPGDEVVLERPAYEPLLSVAQYLGAQVRRFARRPEDGFAVGPEEVARAVTPRTKAIVLTNLHNPSSALVDQETLRRLGAIARGVGARVVVDEVYLDTLFEKPPPSAFHLDPGCFVVTSSLTKAYGLSGLRCGWVVADPELARRMWRIFDLLGAVPAHPAERLSAIALDHLTEIGARARVLLETNRGIWNEFLESRTDLEGDRLEGGTTAFPRLERGNADELSARLREHYETTVVPGRFFEMPDHFRVAIGCPTETLREGLARLASALDQLGAEATPR